MPRIQPFRAIAVALWFITGSGCAGDLEDPKRFDAVLMRFSDAGASGQAGAGSGGRGGSGGVGGMGGSSGRAGSTSGAGGSSGAGGMSGASGGMAGMAGAAGAPPACVGMVLEESCGMTGCHDRSSAILDLVSPGVQARLLDKPSTSSICKDRVFIDGEGGASLLIDKLESAPPCGSPMPLIGMLSAADRTCLEDWVEELGGGN